MGDIAAPAAGNADFGEELRATFQQHDFGIGSGLGAGDGGKKTRRAAADHNDPSRTHPREFNRAPRQSLSKARDFFAAIGMVSKFCPVAALYERCFRRSQTAATIKYATVFFILLLV
jgi:hypothetical protein